MNPVEWLKLTYETFGTKYPIGSLLAVMILGAVLFGGVWRLGATLYEKEKSSHAKTVSTVPASRQTGDATATGDGNIANTGDGNTFDVDKSSVDTSKKR